mgnify:CR=1 FL=1
MLPAEQNYTVAERELLAIKAVFTEWRHHLLGAKHTITIFTDHKNLQFFSSVKALTPRQMRWLHFFIDFDFIITYRPGTKQLQSDILSRIGQSEDFSPKDPPLRIIPPKTIVAAIEVDSFMTKVKMSLQSLHPSDWIKKPKNNIKDEYFFHDDKLFIPTDELRQQVIAWNHDTSLAGHPGIQKTLDNCLRHFGGILYAGIYNSMF